MVHIRLQITGIDAALAALRGLDDLSGLMPAHAAGLELLRFAARDYPPEPPGSTYTRTYTLRGGWDQPELDLMAGTITASLSNPVPYADFVQGPDQAWMHAGRWETIGAIGARLEDEVVDLIGDGVEAWLRGAGW